jgi:hypothetical protein
MLLHTVAVGDTPRLHGEAVADFEIAPLLTLAQCWAAALDETHIRDQAGAIVFV